MFRTFLAALTTLTLVLTGSMTRAMDVPCLLCQKGQMVVNEKLTEGNIPADWKSAKGDWAILNGGLKGVEKTEDDHAAVIRTDIAVKDMVCEYSVRFDGGKGTGLSINDSKGHVCRLRMDLTTFAINKDKATKTSTDTAVPLDTEKVAIKPGEWHEVRVEICGPFMMACLDGNQVVFGSHDGINVEKTSIGFPVSGEGVTIKDVRVWEATPAKNAEMNVNRLRKFRKQSGSAKR